MVFFHSFLLKYQRGRRARNNDWGAYRNLHHHVPNITVHQTVTHQNSFVDPVTGGNVHKRQNQPGHDLSITSKEKKASVSLISRLSWMSKCGGTGKDSTQPLIICYF